MRSAVCMGTAIATTRARAAWVGVEGVDGEVEQGGVVAAALEDGGGPRHRQRLMAELVAGHQQDVARIPHATQCTRPVGPHPSRMEADPERGGPLRLLTNGSR